MGRLLIGRMTGHILSGGRPDLPVAAVMRRASIRRPCGVQKNVLFPVPLAARDFFVAELLRQW